VLNTNVDGKTNAMYALTAIKVGKPRFKYSLKSFRRTRLFYVISLSFLPSFITFIDIKPKKVLLLRLLCVTYSIL
jgi:hypothetical protein